MKRFFSFLICIFVLANMFSSSIANISNIKIKTIIYKIGSPKMDVDGVLKDIDPGRSTSPIIENGRSLLPIRSLIEILGGSVSWQKDNSLITIKLNKKEIKLWVDSNISYVDNKKTILDVPPRISNSRTVMPLRFITENLGFSVTWNPNEKSILIDTTTFEESRTSKSITNYVTHKVVPGESLWSISRKYNTTIEEIMDLNKLSSDKIYYGQIIKISGKNINTTNKMLIENILSSNRDNFSEILDNKDKYEVQILYTKIDRTINNNPIFTSYEYNLNENNYFYPAGSIKLPISLLALEKLNSLKMPSLNKYSSMKIDDYKNQPGEEGTIATYIKNALMYNDYNAFDRLYEFLGQEYINTALWQKGLSKSLIMHRLGTIMTYENNRYTNPLSFKKENDIIYYQKAKYNSTQYSNKGLNNLLRGTGTYTENGIIPEPKDFTHKNFISIKALHSTLKSLLFPEYNKENEGFDITEKDREFILNNLEESSINGKYFVCGSNEPIPAGMKIYNKSGIAYGNVVDNAYIVDEKNNVEFILTSVIYTNRNNIIGDNNYEYYSIGIPFLKDLSFELYEYSKNN
ncbi:MAG: stalk domain-containing protein [Clostridiales bacterium]